MAKVVDVSDRLSETGTLEVPGAELTYDLRKNASSDADPPDDRVTDGRRGFTALARHIADRTVVTYDTRARSAAGRPSRVLLPRRTSTPFDVHRLIRALDAGPVESSRAAAAR